MRSRRAHTDRLLAWYPTMWRERYGDELVALMEDTLDGRRPTLRFRLSVAGAGLRERGHGVGLIGESTPAAERVRAGGLVVFCCWALFVAAGGGFAKAAEHFATAVPAGPRPVAVAAYDVVVVMAAVAGLAVAVGAGLALPAFVGFLRGGGWASIRGHVLQALGATAAAGAALAGLVAASRNLTGPPRRGDWRYLVAGAATALLLAAALGLWTLAGVATARRLVVPTAILRREAALAAVVAAAMVVMTAATALWWAVIGTSAPSFLQGMPVDPDLVPTMALMLAASAGAGYGVLRMARSRSALRLG